jgi:hypothetical protein
MDNNVTTQELTEIVQIQQRLLANLWVVVEHSFRALDYRQRCVQIRADLATLTERLVQPALYKDGNAPGKHARDPGALPDCAGVVRTGHSPRGLRAHAIGRAGRHWITRTSGLCAGVQKRCRRNSSDINPCRLSRSSCLYTKMDDFFTDVDHC